jgi:plasmid stability protein
MVKFPLDKTQSNYIMVPKWNREVEITMVTITVKNIPDEIYERIKQQAKANRRSINSEIIAIFEQAIPKRSPTDVKEIMERARKVRELTSHYTINQDEMNRWKKDGRE